jgi:hypothetical protein
MTIESVFDAIYANNAWGNPESKSGPGSTLGYTLNIRQEILDFCNRFSIKTFFDAPCGDFNWMKVVAFPDYLRYIGGDLSHGAVENNKTNFTSANRTFINFNITRDPFPIADVWFCRDCMFHLSYRDIFSALSNFVHSGIPFLFMTTHIINFSGFRNRDIESGGNTRLLDFFLPPFDLPREVSFWAADYIYPFPRREMCVWTREQIALALSSMPGKGLFATDDVALNKPARQSSISQWSHHPTVEQDARGANSEPIALTYAFHTNYERDPWWQVDLEKEINVRKIIILNSLNYPERLLHFSLLKSADGQSWEVIYQKVDDMVLKEPDLSMVTVTFSSDGHVARFIRVRLDGENFLHLRKVQVFGMSGSRQDDL